MRPLAVLALAAAAALAVPSAAAQAVALAGQMGSRALLVIDGQTQMLAPGETARGVKLLQVEAGEARVEVGGLVSTLRTGAAPVSVGGAPRAAGSEIVMTAGPGGHFIVAGAINGRAVRFMVDTGATLVSIGREEAERLGIDWRSGTRGMAQTANGTVAVWGVTLRSVRVGDVEIANVQALVMPMPTTHILLGNSFLSRFQMRRENDVMRLEFRR